MKFQSEIVVTGMKASKGDYDGTAYDSTKVYVETSLDESKDKARGMATLEYTLGKSDEFEKFKHLPFPIIAIGEFEIVTTGKDQKTVLLAVKPTKRSAPAA